VLYLGQSPADLADAVDILVIRHALEAGDSFGLHEHPQQQLSWTPTGALSAEVGDRYWLLPPTVGLWIPGGVRHDVRAVRSGVFYGIYFRTEDRPITWATPTVLAMTPIVRSLVVHLAEADLSREERGRAEAVLFDNLRAAPDAHLVLPMPSDPRALAVARALIARPADGRTLDEWGHSVGASRRTLVRLFQAETNLTFAQWRTHLRMSAATGHLAGGASVQTTARLVGYEDPGAFIVAFQKTLGSTPGTYLATRPVNDGVNGN
jgi:AraC-like DNA-binding protein